MSTLQQQSTLKKENTHITTKSTVKKDIKNYYENQREEFNSL